MKSISQGRKVDHEFIIYVMHVLNSFLIDSDVSNKDKSRLSLRVAYVINNMFRW